MTFRMLMVRLMPDDAEGEISKAFSEHDASGVPEAIGAVHRSLYRYHGIYLHLIEAPHDIRPQLATHAGNPAFRQVDERLSQLLRPVDPQAPSLRQAQARCFYEWNSP